VRRSIAGISLTLERVLPYGGFRRPYLSDNDLRGVRMDFTGLLDDVAHALVAELLSSALIVIDADRFDIRKLAEIETNRALGVISAAFLLERPVLVLGNQLLGAEAFSLRFVENVLEALVPLCPKRTCGQVFSFRDELVELFVSDMLDCLETATDPLDVFWCEESEAFNMPFAVGEIAPKLARSEGQECLSAIDGVARENVERVRKKSEDARRHSQ